MKTEDIIKVLEYAKKEIINGQDFLCICINDGMQSYGFDFLKNITDVIPEFNRELADEIVGTDHEYAVAWWNEKDKEPRIKFMDYLIDLYKKKL